MCWGGGLEVGVLGFAGGLGWRGENTECYYCVEPQIWIRYCHCGWGWWKWRGYSLVIRVLSDDEGRVCKTGTYLPIFFFPNFGVWPSLVTEIVYWRQEYLEEKGKEEDIFSSEVCAFIQEGRQYFAETFSKRFPVPSVFSILVNLRQITNQSIQLPIVILRIAGEALYQNEHYKNIYDITVINKIFNNHYHL